MRLSLIVAVSENGVIGRRGQLPWHISSDLRRFKQLTMGHHIIMGRLTFESIGRILPGRTTVVVTHQPDYQAEGAIVATGIGDAIRIAEEDSDAFVIGGRQIYHTALPMVQRLYLTRVHASVEGDVFFPELNWKQWQLVQSKKHPPSEKDQYTFSFEIFERSKPKAKT